MNTELNEAAEKILDKITVGVHHPQFREAIITCMKEFAQWQLEQLKMPDGFKSLTIQSIFELDKNADENWRSSKQFTNGEVVKILKDFVAVHQQQAVSVGVTGIELLKRIGYDNDNITGTEIWIAEEVFKLLQQQVVTDEEIVDIIKDEPGIELLCSNYPYCKCDEENRECTNFIGLAQKLKSALQYAKQSPWIKASERLPNDGDCVMKLAEKEYPPFRENKYGIRSEVSDAGREGYIKGFKSALQYSVGDGWIEIKTETDNPPENTIVWGFNKKWIDEDFNPEGVRECHYNDGEWNTAKWDNDQDDYYNECTWATNEGKGHAPTHWRQLPSPPINK